MAASVAPDPESTFSVGSLRVFTTAPVVALIRNTFRSEWEPKARRFSPKTATAPPFPASDCHDFGAWSPVSASVGATFWTVTASGPATVEAAP